MVIYVNAIQGQKKKKRSNSHLSGMYKKVYQVYKPIFIKSSVFYILAKIKIEIFKNIKYLYT